LSGSFESIKQKADLVRGINLGQVLDGTGALKDKFDKAKWHTSKGTISICGPKFMNWAKDIGGGGAIDLVMHLKNFDFKTAVLWLDTVFSGHHIQIPPNKIKAKSILQLPKKDNTKISQVINYLVKIRSIPLSLVSNLIHSGKLYADTKGNAVFLLLGKEKKVVGAELRGTNHTIWRGMAKGSKKDLGLFRVRSHNPDKIVLLESAIDAISFFALYSNCMAISTSGASPNPAWLISFINKESQIYCGFDSDDTGEKTAKKMMALYPTIKRLRPPKHDWNDVLKTKLNK
jgi:5S rRNA maturation endonuclease (ribonuclease M5)